MSTLKAVEVVSREAWREWLAVHHDAAPSVWLVFFKQGAERTGVSYDDALDEALCFGWVDSLVRRLDAQRYARKFTPRVAGSSWSTINRKRFERLVSEGRMTPFGMSKAPPPAPAEEEGNSSQPAGLDERVPEFIDSGLRASEQAWSNFASLAPSHRRLYVKWIMAAKKDETRRRRLGEAIGRLEKNLKLGLK
jgi:uncharacterized protein YdeI (YjbR/CyaY-like superfamily)